MKAIEFPQQTAILAKDQPQYSPLPVHFDKDAEGQPMTACFQFTPEELAEMNRTGVIWISQLTFGNLLQPIRIATTSPFEYQAEIKPRSISTLNDIDRTSPEGRLFFAALTVLTTKVYANNTPDEVISAINGLAFEMEQGK